MWAWAPSMASPRPVGAAAYAQGRMSVVREARGCRDGAGDRDRGGGRRARDLVPMWSLDALHRDPAGRGRPGPRWSVTARWFVAGAVLGGLTLGALMAGLAAVVGVLGVSTSTALGIATVAALVCAASDLDPFGLHIPFHGRQVNERWLDQYRAWVYGGGFGWQIGCGLATYITTAGMYLTILLAALTGNPLAALAIGAGFGLVRGLAIYAGRSITTTERLLAAHRLGALRRPVRLATIGVMLAVGVVAAGAWVGLAGALAAAAASALIVLFANLSHRERAAQDGLDTVATAPGTGPAGVAG